MDRFEVAETMSITSSSSGDRLMSVIRKDGASYRQEAKMSLYICHPSLVSETATIPRLVVPLSWVLAVHNATQTHPLREEDAHPVSTARPIRNYLGVCISSRHKTLI